MDPKRIGVAFSGGVDSLCALYLLRQAGHRVFAIHAQMARQESAEELASLGQACSSLEIPFYAVDCREEFHKAVIHPWLSSMERGLTPNPCVSCNRYLKFGLLARIARQLGAELFATGHYARLVPNIYGSGELLSPAADARKDQGYFLGLLPKNKLEWLLFPLANMTKAECRRVVAEAGLEPAFAAESQDICFMEPGESAGSYFARRRLSVTAGQGDIFVHNAAVAGQLQRIGRHGGLWHYTIGQRKGLGVPWHEPLYVREKDYGRNALILATREDVLISACDLRPVNYFVPRQAWPDKLRARLRYRQPPAGITAQAGAGGLRLVFTERQLPGAQGQLAVIEDCDGRILAGGLIERMYLRQGS